MKTLPEKRDFLTRQIAERKGLILDAERSVKEHEKALAGLYGALDTVEMMEREAAEATQAAVAKAAGRGEVGMRPEASSGQAVAGLPSVTGQAIVDLSDAPQNLG